MVSRFEELLADGAHAFERQRLTGHLTASAWVLDAAREHVLLVHHRKLGKWLQPGGHADGEMRLLEVARTEVREETGVEAEPLADGGIFDVDIHPIPARPEAPEHEHFDIRFLLCARGTQSARGNEENHEARWVPLRQVEELTTEESILRMRAKARAALAAEQAP